MKAGPSGYMEDGGKSRHRVRTQSGQGHRAAVGTGSPQKGHITQGQGAPFQRRKQVN